MNKYKEWKDHFGELIDSKNGYDLIECQSCNFKHIIPIPTQKNLSQIYRDDYYKKEKPKMITEIANQLDWWNQFFEDRYEIFDSICRTNQPRILDIGCGPGFMLKKGKELGWQTVGVEPSIEAANYANEMNLEVINGDFENLDYGKLGSFDAINISEVLEHISCPKYFLDKAYQLLKKPGSIFVMVPNDYNIIQNILRDYQNYEPYWLAPPHYINYFTKESIINLMQRVGFEILLVETTFPMEVFLLSGLNYVEDREDLGRKLHDGIKEYEKSLVNSNNRKIKRDIYRKLAELGIGRDLMVYGKK